jgi:hypothetical protein
MLSGVNEPDLGGWTRTLGAVPLLTKLRGAIALAGAVAVLAASGCGGGAATSISKATTTVASTTTSSTISVPTHVFVMSSGSERLVAPGEFSFNVYGAVVGEHLHWTNWGQPSATADGVFSERRFSSSNRVHFRSTLRLTRLRVCRGAEYYTHAVVPLPSSGPFRASVNRLSTPCG